MSHTADVVIGTAYGDEGKGLMVDALAARGGADATVVRFNGGAQAGHTVTLPQGTRHVFHHVGSGALGGAATFLSRYFIANPILLGEELAALARLGMVPRLAIDPAALVTTPYDMMINQFAEAARGGARHGSCGLGIGETVERSNDPALSLKAGDLLDRRTLADRLARIRATWVPQRLARLGAWPLTDADAALVASDAVLERWLEDAEHFLQLVDVRDVRAATASGPVVFEGAQGLLLDQDRGAFPHVTRSNTGLKNALALAHDAGIAALNVTYVTRTYVTRHGAGPLAHELPGPPHADVVDATNVPNPWQGSLRFGTLDLDLLARTVGDDLADAAGTGIAVAHGLAVTCLDQIGERPTHVASGRLERTSPEALAHAAARSIGADRLTVSHGPTRADVSPLHLLPAACGEKVARRSRVG